MFFIVSGFLVGGSVWRLIAQARFDLGAYLINRFARIYLVFIPALLLVLVLEHGRAASSWQTAGSTACGRCCLP